MQNLSMSFWLKASASLLVLSAALADANGACAGALPTQGRVIAGQASINKANRSLTVKQSSTTGIIDWKSFSIGSRNNVTFDNGSGATLNRVTGGNLSTIAGSLHASGSLYLMNNAGVIVAGSGRVITGGNFLASSGNPAGNAFDPDDQRIRGAKAAVINRGTITAGGQATLNGGSVTNTGSVTAANVSLYADSGNAIGGGTVHATGDATAGGKILLISEAGKTSVTGSLVARGHNASIETSGQTLSVGGTVDAGKGGTWLLDPQNLTVTASSAKTIDNSLGAGTNVTLKTTATGTSGPGTASSGAGDIAIDSALSWSTSAKLALDAYHGIAIDKTISVTGAGGVILKTNDGGAGGDYDFASGASLDYGSSNVGGSLTINGAAFTLLYSMSQLQNNNTANRLGRDFALARSLSAASVTGWIPIGTDGQNDITGNGFSGIFEGLGHTISKLTVDTGGNDYAGLFGYSTGTIRDIALAGGSTTGDAAVGGLVGEVFSGTILNDSNTGTVSGDTITGGLVGQSFGSVSNSFATGKVTAQADVGGLVGQNFGSVSTSYATGTVKGGASDEVDIGGLVGTNDGTVTLSYATGAVTGSGTVGGLVGGNYSLGSAGTISNSYALGPVAGSSSSGNDVGGLVGINEAGTISDVYAVGSVAGGGTVGGLIGAISGGTVSHAYWDTQTSGHAKSGAGTGLTTAQIQAGLQSGFSSAVWSIVAGESFPYLSWQFGGGTPEVISGTVTGEASASGQRVSIFVNGSPVASTTFMASGANGYYSDLLAPGTIPGAGADVLAYLGSGIPANTVYENATGSLVGFNLAANTLTVDSSAKSELTLVAGLETALGTNNIAALYTTNGAFTPDIDLDLNLSVSSFEINHNIDIGSGTLTLEAAGTIGEGSSTEIDAEKITGKSHGAMTLTGSKNKIARIQAFSTGNAHDFSLTDDEALAVYGALDAGVISLTTVGSGNDITVHGPMTGTTVNLVATGAVNENSSAGAITASTVLNVTAATGIDLVSTKNNIKKLGTDKTTSGPNKVTL